MKITGFTYLIKLFSLLIVLTVIQIKSSNAQELKTKETIFDEASVVYKESYFGGLMLHTNGFGGHFSYGRNITAFKSRVYQIDAVFIKHPKEIRSFNAFSENSRSFIFGKLNTFLVLRPTIGNRVMKFDKIRTSGVAVGYSWRLGPSLGITKPIYLEVLDEDASFFRVSVEKATADLFQDRPIYGRAGGLRGLNEIQFHPGVHGALALNFDYDPQRQGIKGLEVGLSVDYFPLGEVEIMALAENTKLFVNLFVILQIGKKVNP